MPMTKLTQETAEAFDKLVEEANSNKIEDGYRAALQDSRNMSAVLKELASARKGNKKFNSAHEGWAVIWEELDELWDEVRKKRSARSLDDMRKEAMQVAAMAIRFMTDICPQPEQTIKPKA